MNYKKAIEGLNLTHDQFVDLCILLGCDYCDSIKGIGPKKALAFIREYGCIEKILENLDRKKFTVPDDWVPNEKKAKEAEETEEAEYDTDEEKEKTGKPKSDADEEDTEEEVVPIYVKARKLFNEHEVITNLDLKWKECQVEALTKYLVDEMGFNPDRVKSNIEKLQKAQKANTKPQSRMDSFFKPLPSKPGAKKPAKATAGSKRKANDTKGKKGAFFKKR